VASTKQPARPAAIHVGDGIVASFERFGRTGFYPRLRRRRRGFRGYGG
jgi:hypothetical protein